MHPALLTPHATLPMPYITNGTAGPSITNTNTILLHVVDNTDSYLNRQYNIQAPKTLQHKLSHQHYCTQALHYFNMDQYI